MGHGCTGGATGAGFDFSIPNGLTLKTAPAGPGHPELLRKPMPVFLLLSSSSVATKTAAGEKPLTRETLALYTAPVDALLRDAQVGVRCGYRFVLDIGTLADLTILCVG
jgi:hypothetical protein